MPTIEGLRLKLLKIPRLGFANSRKKQLLKNDFTIISNNCWGGMVYESYNLKKMSPTVGLYFMADDYLKFVSNLRHYVRLPLKFIRWEDSKWSSSLMHSKICPVGKLGDIEIFFLHYHSEQEAIDKWTRRCKRINWDNLIVKFNDQNGCTQKNVEDFCLLPYTKKVFFTVKKWNVHDKNSVIFRFPQYSFARDILASHEPFGANHIFNVTKYINE